MENLKQPNESIKKDSNENPNQNICYSELPPPINDRAILTIKEVADFLRVHRTTVSGYAKAGELKSYKVKGRRLFKSVDVWSFFENQVALECVSGKEGCLWLR